MYFCDCRYSELQIHVVVKKELFVSGPKKMKMKKFLKEYLYEDWYLSDIVPQEMMDELGVSIHEVNTCQWVLITNISSSILW